MHLNLMPTAKFSLVAAALVVMSVILPASTTLAQPSPMLSQKATSADAITAVAQQKGFARIIVEFAPPTPAATRPDPALLADVKARVREHQDAIVRRHFESPDNPRPGNGFPRALRRLEISPMFAVNASLAEIERLAADPAVVSIHEDRLLSPNLDQSVPLIGMTGPGGAFGFGATGQGQAVAIVDTGVQSSHPFITAAKVVAEACFSNSAGFGVSLCPNGQTMQTGQGAADPTMGACLNGRSNLCDHGTHVAGIAAGQNSTPGNPTGSPANGVARNASIVAVQVFTRFNDQAFCGDPNMNPAPCATAFTSDIMSALDWIFQNALKPAAGVSLAAVDLSLGGLMSNGSGFTSSCDNDPLKPSIDRLRNAGVATVVSAGNDSFRDAVRTPACISTAIAVGSTTKEDAISNFSDIASMVALLAPGGTAEGPCQLGAFNEDILGPVTTTNNQIYSCIAGTSQAAPHVAGAFAAIRSAAPNQTVDQIVSALKNTGEQIADNRPAIPATPGNPALPAGTQIKPRIQVNLAVQSILGSGTPASVVASVLPNARTTTLNTAVTAFATILNNGTSTGVACAIAPPAGLPASFTYQTTNPTTNTPVGVPNTPATIPPSQGQTFVFAITPNQPMSQEIPLIFDCANTMPAASVAGLNTFLLTASSVAIPDMLSIADTFSHDGNTVITGSNGQGVMAVAAIDIGAPGTVTFSPSDTAFGQSPRNLPLNLAICQTNASGTCINPTTPGAAATVNVAKNQTVSFTVFATGQGSLIPYDPANNRLFVLATQGLTPVGEASTAVKMETVDQLTSVVTK